MDEDFAVAAIGIYRTMATLEHCKYIVDTQCDVSPQEMGHLLRQFGELSEHVAELNYWHQDTKRILEFARAARLVGLHQRLPTHASSATSYAFELGTEALSTASFWFFHNEPEKLSEALVYPVKGLLKRASENDRDWRRKFEETFQTGCDLWEQSAQRAESDQQFAKQVEFQAHYALKSSLETEFPYHELESHVLSEFAEFAEQNRIGEQWFRRLVDFMGREQVTGREQTESRSIIDEEFKTRPLSKVAAARYLGRYGDGSRWLSNCIKDGTIVCEKLSRQQFVFDIRQFPAKSHPFIAPRPSGE
ncbi:hypothetical protein Enr13x_56580 [Stieleria neptunia]|uniref:Uncharacterized protein n=2 Tax=Stieleria neptunia TaxID=2527979 RepID=A0A518HY60_9BACT|nr:hypothetical protein Enr13x_56580 [Stieleria neptunia]